jgi:transcription termination factor 2
VKRRETLYREHPEGDEELEENVFSRATRRSIFGTLPKAEKSNHDNEVESDDEVIISISDESEEEENSFHPSQMSKLSSTLHSPDQSIHDESLSRVVKEEPKSFDDKSFSEKSNGNLKRVSRSYYDQAVQERDTLESKLKSIQKGMAFSGNLPDGGVKLKETANAYELELSKKKNEIFKMVIEEEDSIKERIKRSFQDSTQSIEESSYEPTGESINRSSSTSGIGQSSNIISVDDVKPKEGIGKYGMKNFYERKAITEEKLQDMHQSVNQRPADDVLATQPKHLKATLMKHQLHALAFMTWRESNKGKAGILADDMGLGKTLTAISLIMKGIQDDEEKDEEDSSEDEGRSEWIAQGRKDLRSGGTLVICPATLMKQWEHEIQTKVRRGALDVLVFHGAKRPTRARELTRYDVVITTYQIIVSEHKNEGCVFGVRWDRIILDEGHVIRNSKSKQAEAVCSLEAKKRWVMTGTPVQNKEFDMFATIKFLRCKPFDDIGYWRQWIEVKGNSNQSSPRLQALLKAILLRRTKQQLMQSGEITSLPVKENEKVIVHLKRAERVIYSKVLAFSQHMFANYLKQQQEKHNEYVYDKTQLGRVYSKFAKIHKVDHEVQTHEILTLILRLRQVCCHPGLMKKFLENKELTSESLNSSFAIEKGGNDSDVEIMNRLQNMKIGDESDDNVNNQLLASQAISLDDEIFSCDIPSSKLEKLMELVHDRLETTDDKMIIVSQWTKYLEIVRNSLEAEGIEFCEMNGSVPVKNRNNVVVKFNNANDSTRIMLLSITAGGVGLNLVGANLLFILDPHW